MPTETDIEYLETAQDHIDALLIEGRITEDERRTLTEVRKLLYPIALAWGQTRWNRLAEQLKATAARKAKKLH